MKWAVIWELIKINILYSNPQGMVAVKKVQTARKDASFSAYKSVLMRQATLLFFFLFIYLYLFIGIDYSKSIGYFSMQLALLTLVATIYGFTGLFSVFYDSHDTKIYLALPVKPQEVYLAKLLSSQGMVLPFLMPCLSLLLICYWQISQSVWVTLLAIPSFFILFLSVNVLALILLNFIGQILTRSPYKKTISTGLMVLSSLLAFMSIMYLQTNHTMTIHTDDSISAPVLPFFRGLHDIIAQPFSTDSLLHFWLPLLLLGFLLFLVYLRIVPNYFNQILHIQARGTSTSKKASSVRKEASTLRQALIKHHLSTLKDSTLITQSFIQPIIFGVAMIPGLLNNGDKMNLSQLGNDYFGIFLLAGAIIGCFFVGPSTFLGVAMSLERNNYHFIRSLPLPFQSFTIQKFLLLSLIQFSIPTLLYFLICLLLFKLPLLLTLSFIVGILVSAFLLGQLYYWRDQRLLVLNWQNINQLFARGSSQWIYGGTILLGMLGGSLLLVLSFSLAQVIDPLMISLGLCCILFLIALSAQAFFLFAYWKKLVIK